MSHRIALALTIGFCLSSRSDAADVKRLSLSNLSLEVAALRTLHRFQLTPPQMEALQKLAAETVPKPAPRQDGKGSAKLRQTLIDMHDALLRGDGARIDRLEEQLDELLDADDTDLDDEVELGAAARRRAPEVLLTSPRQFGAFIINLTEELPDPLERLLGALDQVGKLKDDEWNELSEEIVDELSWQLGGLDADRSRFVAERVGQYLRTVRSLNEREFKKQRPELEKAARRYVGQVPAAAVLHNVAEHTLAELLSNPAPVGGARCSAETMRVSRETVARNASTRLFRLLNCRCRGSTVRLSLPGDGLG